MEYKLPHIRVKTERVFVTVVMRDQVKVCGYISTYKLERLQDIMNDERDFIPLRHNLDDDAAVIISKRHILTIEEVPTAG